MIGVDSNLLLRLILDDDPDQSAIVERIYANAGNGGIYVSLIVVAELAWVLKRGYKEKPEEVLDIIGDLLNAREFTLERSDIVKIALSDAREAGCGIADALIARMNEEAGAATTLTFDIRAKRLSTMRDAVTYR